MIFRVDGGPHIGSGHVARCSAIAHELEGLGARALFAVSDEHSASMVRVQGLDARVVGGSFRRLDASDAENLDLLASEFGASTILVDSYGITMEFFERLRDLGDRNGFTLAYLDDAYTYELGTMRTPVDWPVDLLVNYSFGASCVDYRTAGFLECDLLIGPGFAPLRKEFRDVGYVVRNEVERILVTCGSTNPDGLLERLVDEILSTAPRAVVDVVVGSQAVFEGESDLRVRIHRDVKNMADLMMSADLAVSAAGSTLYELAAVGVPTIAVCIVENQLGNTRGFKSIDLGLALEEVYPLGKDLPLLMNTMILDVLLRGTFRKKMRETVDGRGALRIAEKLIAFSGGQL